jgi:hypothetical protein
VQYIYNKNCLLSIFWKCAKIISLWIVAKNQFLQNQFLNKGKQNCDEVYDDLFLNKHSLPKNNKV